MASWKLAATIALGSLQRGRSGFVRNFALTSPPATMAFGPASGLWRGFAVSGIVELQLGFYSVGGAELELGDPRDAWGSGLSLLPMTYPACPSEPQPLAVSS